MNFPRPHNLAAKLKDGRTALVTMIGKGVYDGVDFADIGEFLPKGLDGQVAPVRHKDSRTSSLWAAYWNWVVRKNQLWEVSASTLKPTSRRAFKSQRINVFPFDQIFHLFGDIALRNDPSVSLSQSPYFHTTYILGLGDTLWIAYTDDLAPSNTRKIIGYRPGGSKRGKLRTESWIGPFLSPDGAPITNMHASGADHLLVTTRKASYLVSCSEAAAGTLIRPRTLPLTWTASSSVSSVSTAWS